MTLSRNIKIFRKEAGLTQKALANQSGLSFSMISKLESGEQTNPSFDTIRKISDVLQVSPGDLLSDSSTIEDQIDEYIAYKRGLNNGKPKATVQDRRVSRENLCTDLCTDLNFRKKLQAINMIPEPVFHDFEEVPEDPDQRPEMKKLLFALRNASSDEIIEIARLVETFRRI